MPFEITDDTQLQEVRVTLQVDIDHDLDSDDSRQKIIDAMEDELGLGCVVSIEQEAEIYSQDVLNSRHMMAGRYIIQNGTHRAAFDHAGGPLRIFIQSKEAA